MRVARPYASRWSTAQSGVPGRRGKGARGMSSTGERRALIEEFAGRPIPALRDVTNDEALALLPRLRASAPNNHAWDFMGKNRDEDQAGLFEPQRVQETGSAATCSRSDNLGLALDAIFAEEGDGAESLARRLPARTRCSSRLAARSAARREENTGTKSFDGVPGGAEAKWWDHVRGCALRVRVGCQLRRRWPCLTGLRGRYWGRAACRLRRWPTIRRMCSVASQSLRCMPATTVLWRIQSAVITRLSRSPRTIISSWPLLSMWPTARGAVRHSAFPIGSQPRTGSCPRRIGKCACCSSDMVKIPTT
jgi:hypothetical protein